MARWRAEALDRLPELRKAITAADSVMALWIYLESAFERAYQRDPRDESLIGRIYAFADWCMKAPRSANAAHDPMTAVTIAFYQDIPACKPARDDMACWFSYAEVANNREVFACNIGDEGFDALLKEMAKSGRGYRPRQRAEP